MLHLTTLGVARSTPDGLQPKRLALLTYLAIARPRGAHRRDALVAIFWPELDQQRARSALRQAVHAIREQFGRDIIVSSGTELLELNRALVTCDLWDLETAEHDRVLALYTGEFLAGLHLSDAPEFEEWRANESHSLRTRVIESAWAAADRAVANGDHQRAADFVRRAITMEPLDEESVRRGMRLLNAIGERAAALAELKRFSDLLDRELGVKPTAETRALAAELQTNEPVVRRRSSPSVPQSAVRARSWRDRPWRPVAAAVSSIALASAVLFASAARTNLDPRRIDVLTIVNESRDTSLDAMAHNATLDLRARLATLQHVEIVSETPRASRAAGTIVRGLVRLDGDTVELRAEVVDRTAGTLSRSVVARVAQSERADLVPLFSDRMQTAVATALYPGWGTALRQPVSYTSYRRFAAGMNAIKREEHESALTAFRSAFDTDSTFTAAGLMAAAELMQMRRFRAADSVTRAVAARGATLPSLDAALLEWLQRSLRGDREGARASMQRVTEVAPAAELAWLQLAIEHSRSGRPELALAALDRIDETEDAAEGWLALWATRIEALHHLGRHQQEFDVARRGLREHPNLRVLSVYQLRALAALGRTGEIERTIQLFPASGEGGISLEQAIRQTAMELEAHGHDASALLARMAEPSRTGPLSAAYTMYLRRDYAGALAIYDSIRVATPKCADCVGITGVVAARMNDTSTALRRAAELAAVNVAARPHLYGRHHLWQARIANVLGDRVAASRHLIDAFAAGFALDVMTHADPDLAGLNPDSLYRAYSQARASSSARRE